MRHGNSKAWQQPCRHCHEQRERPNLPPHWQLASSRCCCLCLVTVCCVCVVAVVLNMRLIGAIAMSVLCYQRLHHHNLVHTAMIHMPTFTVPSHDKDTCSLLHDFARIPFRWRTSDPLFIQQRRTVCASIDDAPPHGHFSSTTEHWLGRRRTQWRNRKEPSRQVQHQETSMSP